MVHLLKRMRRQEWLMVCFCLLLVLGQIYFELKLPDYMSSLTSMMETPGSTVADVAGTGVKMLFCALAGAAFSILCVYLAAQIAAGFSYTIRGGMFRQILSFGQEEMQSFSVPSLITRTTNDITQIQMLIAIGLHIFLKAPIMAVWSVIKIVTKSWILSAITAGFVLALLVLMAVVVAVILPRIRKVQKLVDNINRISRENLNGISVVHAFNAEDYQADKFEKASDTLMCTQLFNQRAIATIQPAVSFAMNALTLTIYWVGASIVNNVPAADVAARVTAFGDIVVFGTYATYVIMSIMMIAVILMYLPTAQVSAGRINEVLDAEIHLKQGKENFAEETGKVEFQDVSFRYPSSGKDTLEHISFKADRGETVAFIGATGSGKTTLVSLAARFYDVASGTVLINGKDIRKYSFDALYDRIGFVTQKSILFAGNIRENVLFGESAAEQSDENARQALALSQATEFVEKLPGEINAPITQGGANVSGGQKQRLSIARALARKPEILIFDDSFSALDYRTDALLRKGLRENLKDTTCLIVAQRIGTVRNADRIVVLDEGKTVGIGTHEELLKNCPVYREIAISQLSEKELGA